MFNHGLWQMKCISHRLTVAFSALAPVALRLPSNFLLIGWHLKVCQGAARSPPAALFELSFNTNKALCYEPQPTEAAGWEQIDGSCPEQMTVWQHQNEQVINSSWTQENVCYYIPNVPISTLASLFQAPSDIIVWHWNIMYLTEYEKSHNRSRLTINADAHINHSYCIRSLSGHVMGVSSQRIIHHPEQ